VLQRLDRIDAQHGRCAQYLGFLNHRVATLQAFLLSHLQRRGRGMDAAFQSGCSSANAFSLR
jgi:hypothetical protein